MSEAYVPTQQSQAGQEARLQAPDVHAGGTRRDPGSPGQGPRPAVRLIWRVEHRDTFLALRAARRSRSGPLTVAWVPGDPAEPPRVAFAIGRKVGPAVVRNRIRRRLRALVRETTAPVLPGAYLVGVAPGATTSSYGSLGASLDAALRQATRAGARRSIPSGGGM